MQDPLYTLYPIYLEIFQFGLWQQALFCLGMSWALLPLILSSGSFLASGGFLRCCTDPHTADYSRGPSAHLCIPVSVEITPLQDSDLQTLYTLIYLDSEVYLNSGVLWAPLTLLLMLYVAWKLSKALSWDTCLSHLIGFSFLRNHHPSFSKRSWIIWKDKLDPFHLM